MPYIVAKLTWVPTTIRFDSRWSRTSPSSLNSLSKSTDSDPAAVKNNTRVRFLARHHYNVHCSNIIQHWTDCTSYILFVINVIMFMCSYLRSTSMSDFHLLWNVCCITPFTIQVSSIHRSHAQLSTISYTTERRTLSSSRSCICRDI